MAQTELDRFLEVAYVAVDELKEAYTLLPLLAKLVREVNAIVERLDHIEKAIYEGGED